MNLFYKLMGITAAFAEGAEATADAAGAVTDTLTDPNTTGAGSTDLIGMLFGLSPMIILFVIMYFLMIRPEKKRKKKEAEMLAALKHGDRVCTIGGIYGTITNIKDDTITLTVGRENMTMVVARWSIRSVEDVTIENESESLN